MASPRSGPRLAPLGAAAVAILAGAASAPAHAQPTVRVRAETRIELRIASEPEGVLVEGALRDDRGEPLPGRAVTLSVSSAGSATLREPAHTDASGGFAARFPLEVGTYRVSARFEGEERYRGETVAQELDLARAHVRLGLRRADGLPLDRIDLDAPEHPIVVSAESEAGTAGLRVEVTNEVDDVLAAGVIDAAGAVALTLSSQALGPPAAGRLVVRTPGDARRAAAQVEMPVVRFRPTRLTIDVEPRRWRSDGPLTVRGRLEDGTGALARRAVGIFDADRHLTTVLTDDEGRFARALDAELAEGRSTLAIGARFASDAPWRPDARSEVVSVAVAPIGATGSWWWLLPPMLVSGILIALLSRRGRARSSDSREEREPMPAPPGIEAGAVETRATQARDVAGVVLDADEGRPLGGATVTLRGPGGVLDVTSDPEGRFAFADVGDGRWEIAAEAAGYEARSAPLEIPHRGRWRSMRVRLRSYRRVALARYRPLADALSPERRWWAFWTARELAERAPGEVRGEVDAVTAEVERIAYGASPSDQAAVDAVGRRSGALADQLSEPERPVSGRR